MEAQVAVACKLCLDGGTLQWHCKTCGEAMCDSCKVVHTRGSLLRHHEVIPIQEAPRLTENTSSVIDEHLICRIHPEDRYQLVCANCQVLICLICLKEHDDNHTFEKIPEKVKEDRLATLKCSHDIQKKLADYHETKASITQKKDRYKEEVSQNSKTLQSKIDIASRRLIEKLREEEENYKKSLNETENQINQNLHEISELSTQLQKKLITGDISTTTDFLMTVRDKLSNYEEFTTPLEQHPLPLTSCDLKNKDLMDLIGHVEISHDGNVIKTVDFTCELAETLSFPFSSNLVATIDQSKAWVGAKSERPLRLVAKDGKVITDVSAPFLIHNITVNSSGELLASEADGHKIQRLENTKFKEICDLKPFKTRGLFATKKSEILVCLDTFDNCKIVRLSPYGITLQTIQYHSDGQTQLFSYPFFVTESKNGNICVVDYNHVSKIYAVVVVNQNGILQFTYSGTISDTKNGFCPQEVQTDMNNNILISDCGNHRVELLDKTGMFVKFLLTSNDGLKRPIGMSIDDSGVLWICNDSDRKIFLVRYLK